ncbi:stage III sporulation protein AE [Lysinibacillus sp. 2017]|nr:stage III sporulation protein AE [Lysinibacillus sp. S2017]AWE07936.1 stage III sporulation protein AE [Lysinibacillus sp. 2017]TGN31598.1 stage III sporulation protein AE [Lysinibacillus sp. S2017]
MDVFLSMFSEPINSLVTSFLYAALYILFYLLLIALIPQQSMIIEQLFIYIFIVIFAQKVIDAFVVLYELIQVLQHFYIAVIPVITLLLIAIQNIFTILAWNPIIIFLIQAILFISTKLLIPTLLCALFLDVCTKIYPAISFSKAAELLRTSVLSIILAAVIALTSILTFSGVAFFQLNEAVKSPIKKLIESNIPLIGNLIVEGLSFFQKTQSTVSSVVGLGFLTVVWTAAFYPAIVLLLHALLFKVIGAFVEPFSNTRMSSLFDDVGKTLLVLCAVALLLGFSIVFIVLLCIVFTQLSLGGSS